MKGKVCMSTTIEADKFHYVYIIETENAIRRSEYLYSQLKTNRTINDFNELDFVKCSYIKGLMRVVGKTSDKKVLVQAIVNSDEFDMEAISPDFLRPVTADETTVKLLYGKNS